MGAQRHAGLARKAFDPTAIYDPSSRRRRSPTKPTSLPTRFPDEDHAYQPLRRLQVTKLQQNALPPPSSPFKRTARSQSRQRLANIADCHLWGFSVKYSPAQELSDQWNHAKRQEVERAERLQAEGFQAQDREQRARLHAELVRQDYSLYLYLASKYGALDAILYCCTPFPGRLYALLIDQSVRKLQRWRRERLLALRRYWIVRLAREVVDSSGLAGLAQIQVGIDLQHRAAIFLKRLRWRFAASAFRSWFQFTQRQIEVRWRFQFSLQENLRCRFIQWRERIVHLHEFKRQLKQVAHRKRMQSVVVQWVEWKATQQKLRVHLQQQWIKCQRECIARWRAFSNMSKTQRLGAARIQSQWRAYQQRQRYWRMQKSSTTITRLVRDFLARRHVSSLRAEFDIAHVLERIVRTLEWDYICEDLQHKRAIAVEHELVRVARQARFIEDAVARATELVRAELDKVQKNSTHQLLQVRIQQLQTEAVERGARTQDVLIRHATHLLMEETATGARNLAETEFLSHRDAIGRHCNRPVSHNLECVICTATASTLAEHRQVLTPPTPPCRHVSSIQNGTGTPDDLQHSYAKILVELASRDAVIRRQILLGEDGHAT